MCINNTSGRLQTLNKPMKTGSVDEWTYSEK